MAKYCTFCGKQLTDKASFCVHCGNKVVNNTKTPKNKILIFFKNTKFISRILVVLFVILILVFLSTDFDYSNTGLPGSLLLILVPAAIIEYNKNPALSQFKEKNKNRSRKKRNRKNTTRQGFDRKRKRANSTETAKKSG